MSKVPTIVLACPSFWVIEDCIKCALPFAICSFLPFKCTLLVGLLVIVIASKTFDGLNPWYRKARVLCEHMPVKTSDRPWCMHLPANLSGEVHAATNLFGSCRFERRGDARS